jgi:hypothetical protein
LPRWSEPGSVRETSRHGCSGRKPMDPASLVTSCARGRHRFRGAARTHGRRCGASGCRGCCRRSQPVVEPRWCFRRHGWAQVDSEPPMPRPRLPPLIPVAEEEVDSDHGQMALQLACAPRAVTRQSFPLVVLSQPQVAPSTAGARVTPRGLQAPSNRAAAWPQR